MSEDTRINFAVIISMTPEEYQSGFHSSHIAMEVLLWDHSRLHPGNNVMGEIGHPTGNPTHS